MLVLDLPLLLVADVQALGLWGICGSHSRNFYDSLLMGCRNKIACASTLYNSIPAWHQSVVLYSCVNCLQPWVPNGTVMPKFPTCSHPALFSHPQPHHASLRPRFACCWPVQPLTAPAPH